VRRGWATALRLLVPTVAPRKGKSGSDLYPFKIPHIHVTTGPGIPQKSEIRRMLQSGVLGLLILVQL
jgi:hypothetical protein